MKLVVSSVRKYASALLISIICGFLLVEFVSFIPNKWIENNALSSMELTGTGFDYLPIFSTMNAIVDRFSEHYMLSLCFHDETPGLLSPAMNMQGYSRYWHGYTVVLKPLLVVTDITGIYYFNMFVFYGLLFWLLYLISKKLKPAYAFALLLAMIPAHFYIIPICMQYFAVFIISYSTSIYLLCKDNIDGGLLFLIIGCLTSYFDFLTSPLLTLILPLSLFLLKQKLSMKESIKKLLLFSVLWSIGYLMMWAGKWILGSIVLNKSVLKEAADRIELRAGTYDVPRYISVIGTVNQYFGGKTVFTGIAILLELPVVIYGIIRKDSSLVWKIMIQVMPMIWYFLLANHSLMHDYMTFRNVIVIVFLEFIMWIDTYNAFRKKQLGVDK